MVVVHSRGGLGGVGSGDAPDVLDGPVLEGDWGGEEQRVQHRAVESLADERAGAGDQHGLGIGSVVGESCSEISRRGVPSFGRSVRRLTYQRRGDARRGHRR